MARLVRLDGRSAVVRRVKAVAAEIRHEVGDIGRRLSGIERAHIHRCAVAVVVGENAMNAALAGKVPYPEAVRAAGNARRERASLIKALVGSDERNGVEHDWQAAL